MSDLRASALTAGGALAAMAAIAPLGLLVALPRGATEVAALVALVVAVLDVVAAVALVPLLATGGLLLAQISAGLRIAYAAVFAVAAGSLLDPVDEDRFHAVWDAGLLVFGAHLIVAGIAAVRSRLIPTWIGWLVLVAGGGYVADTVLAAVAPSSVSIGAVTFVGEIALLVWLLARGGRERA